MNPYEEIGWFKQLVEQMADVIEELIEHPTQDVVAKGREFVVVADRVTLRAAHAEGTIQGVSTPTTGQPPSP